MLIVKEPTKFATTPGQYKLTTCIIGLFLRRQANRESFLFFSMFNGPKIARIYVLIQLSSLAYLILSGPWIADHWGLLLLELFGLFLGILAIWQMKPSNMNITPVPKPGGQLVTHGIYRIIRHPMYIAQLIVVGALVADYFTFLRLAILIILTFNLLLKLNFEEGRLIRHFDGYAAYRKTSWRLIPFIY